MSIESVMPSNHLILYFPLCLLPSLFASIRVFSRESVLCIRWPKHGASAWVLPMNIHGWLPLGSPCSPGDSQSSPALQFESIKSSVLSIPYGPPLTSIYTGKTIALTICAIVSKVTSLFFDTLSGFVIAFLPRTKHLLIPWLQSPPAVILELKKIKSVTASTFSPSYLPWSDGIRGHYLYFLKAEFQASFFTLLFHLHQELFLFILCH